MTLSQISLFHGTSEEELEIMRQMNCIHRQHFEKNEVIFHMGEVISDLGVVLSGSVLIENTDLWGNRSILSHIPEGHVFAETYAFCNEPLMVSAVTAEPSEILFLNLNLLFNFQKGSFQQGNHFFSDEITGQNSIIRNLLHISMQKNLTLSSRIFCTTPKTIRERLLIYLSAQAVKFQSTTFEIPFNRQGLADYLNLDRSALSKELGRMRDEGILKFHKNKFILHKHSD